MGDWSNFAIAVTAFAGMFGVFLRAMARKDDRAESTILAIVDKHADSIRGMNNESAERSQAMAECVKEANMLTGRTIATIDKSAATIDRAAMTIDKAVATLDEHKELFKQVRSKVGT